MYASQWSLSLRQGDILGKVRFPHAKTRFVWVGAGGGLSAATASEPTQAMVEVSPRYVMVISHDCEFNEGKRTHLLVARIDSVNAKLPPEELDELRRGNDVVAASKDGTPVALDSFIIDPLAGHFESHRRVNFTAVASYPMNYRDEALKLKRAELEHEQRLLLRAKIGYFFSRDADDVSDDQKVSAEEFRRRFEEAERDS